MEGVPDEAGEHRSVAKLAGIDGQTGGPGVSVRITFVMPVADLSGGSRVVADYARHLAHGGHEITVVSQPPRQPSLKQQVKRLIRGRGLLPRVPLPISHFDGLPIQHRVLEIARPMTDRDVPDADVVIATWWETAEDVGRFSASKGAKGYFVQHDERVFLPGNTEWARRVAATWKLPMHKITIAEWLRQLLEEETGHRIDLVPNSVDHAVFYCCKRSRQPRPTVGFMYSEAAFKGVGLMADAVNRARKVIPELRVLAFGQSPPRRADEIPVGVEFQLRPAQATIRDIYSSCDAWLFGSSVEGFGLPILESLACGTPVIGTPAGAAPELLADGGGVIVPHSAPQAMADAIVLVLRQSDGAWEQMSARAVSTAGKYTLAEAAGRFAAALEHVADSAAIMEAAGVRA